MAQACLRSTVLNQGTLRWAARSRGLPNFSYRRNFQNPPSSTTNPPPFAFAFDIDGVLVRSSKPLPRALQALSFLHTNNIPYILLTNGGGKSESERVSDLSRELGIELDVQNFIQSHTPFTRLLDSEGEREGLRNKTILVTGGDGDRVRSVAEDYGFRNVVTPADIYTAAPEVWPFAKNFKDYYSSHARPLPAPMYPGPNQATLPLEEHLKIDAMFVYNDPRDWGLDATIILDLLLSHAGYLGTLSGLNGRSDLPNRGYQQDNQPALWYSNPDLWWAASYHLNRFGQGGFREALDGIWRATTKGAELRKQVCGKPAQATYEFAEQRLIEGRKRLQGTHATGPSRVYMVGDNPASDIMGANNFSSPTGTKWNSILVRSGVYTGGKPAVEPTTTVDDVWDAVRWASKEEGWELD